MRVFYFGFYETVHSHFYISVSESDKTFSLSIWSSSSNSDNYSNASADSSRSDGNFNIYERENSDVLSYLGSDDLSTQDRLFDQEDEYAIVNENGNFNLNQHQQICYRENEPHNGLNQCMERQPLYFGARLSLDESLLITMVFIIRWGLEEKSIEHLLRLSPPEKHQNLMKKKNRI